MMNFLNPIQIVKAQAMNQNVTSAPIHVMLLDNIGMQAQWTGTPTGTIAFQCSLDYTENPFTPGDVLTTGNWTSLTLTPAITQPAGTAGLVLANLNQVPFPWVRLKYTVTGAGVFTIGVVGDTAGSLASKYFLISDGSGNNYAIWFKVSGTGAAPTVAGYTNVEQDITTGDNAATVGTALATTIAALNTAGSFGTSGTSTVTVTLLTAGPWTLPAAGTSGFTITVTAGSGVLNAYANGKGI